MSRPKFTGKVGAKRLSFMVDGGEKLHTAYYVFLKTQDGGEVSVTDDDSPAGIMEAETRSKAITKGKRVLRRLEEANLSH